MENTQKYRRLNILILLCQCIGITNISTIPNVSFSEGILGCIIFFTLTYIFLGIPLLYMETVISQFTNRDCIDVWKINRCTSHVGYILIVWQVLILLYNHTVTSFLMHYLLISFESPVPFYTCGPWSNRQCNIFYRNYTVNKNCIGKQHGAPYCEGLYSTYPEYQYWRFNLVKLDEKHQIAWKICLASGVICILIYLSCFKRERSLKWATYFLAIYPIAAYSVVLTGSLLQKGIVFKFTEALDFDFNEFSKKFRISNIVQRVVYNLGIGSGVTLNLSANSPFRTPCLSNSVICVVICTLFTILTILTTALMTCPYAFVFDDKPETIMKIRMSFLFEKVPRMLYHYERNSFYLITTYSCYTVLGLCTDVMVFYNLLDVAAKRNDKIAKYPGLTCFCGNLVLFLITIPFFSYFGINIFTVSFRRHVITFTIFIAMLECIVFLTWYGVQRFSEDVHFMLGVQPQFCIKTAWILSSLLLGYSFCRELDHHLRMNTQLIYGSYTVSLDPTWGPKTEVLQRSRAMFSVQAMTKEYMYRQYHLKAGILSRQRESNVRNSFN
ncbi:sodium-dependent serotonin transporter-like [Pieris napi]|uniref:sodium-dependent serotonin transporter-like n=1 Tax=Pieris napi TaxID=78633 RepID=UPI001FBC04D7|nr:sodium-dependent serotonin transporter-like [Pieris napi]